MQRAAAVEHHPRGRKELDAVGASRPRQVSRIATKTRKRFACHRRTSRSPRRLPASARTVAVMRGLYADRIARRRVVRRRVTADPCSMTRPRRRVRRRPRVAPRETKASPPRTPAVNDVPARSNPCRLVLAVAGNRGCWPSEGMGFCTAAARPRCRPSSRRTSRLLKSKRPPTSWCGALDFRWAPRSSRVDQIGNHSGRPAVLERQSARPVVQARATTDRPHARLESLDGSSTQLDVALQPVAPRSARDDQAAEEEPDIHVFE